MTCHFSIVVDQWGAEYFLRLNIDDKHFVVDCPNQTMEDASALAEELGMAISKIRDDAIGDVIGRMIVDCAARGIDVNNGLTTFVNKTKESLNG